MQQRQRRHADRRHAAVRHGNDSRAVRRDARPPAAVARDLRVLQLRPGSARSFSHSRSQASHGRSRARRSTPPGAAANARTLANSLSRITLDDNQSAQNPPCPAASERPAVLARQQVPGRRPRDEHRRRARIRLQPLSDLPDRGRGLHACQPARGCPGTGGRHAPRRGDEHAQLLRHAGHHLERHRPRAVRRQREPRLPRSRRRPAARVRPPARQAPGRADRAQRRHHRSQRAREHARTSSRSRASSTACPATTTSTPGRSAPTRSRSASSTARQS